MMDRVGSYVAGRVEITPGNGVLKVREAIWNIEAITKSTKVVGIGINASHQFHTVDLRKVLCMSPSHASSPQNE